jgi:hypothetical protein
VILADELQDIFPDTEYPGKEREELADTAAIFFQRLGNYGYSYLVAGTFELYQLAIHKIPIPGKLRRYPFNKAEFISMESLSRDEMGELFREYRELPGRRPIEGRIQQELERESQGHASSFTSLLKLFDDKRPKSLDEWNICFEKNFARYLNGLGRSLCQFIQEDHVAAQELRSILHYRDKEWDLDLEEVNPGIYNLLCHGVLNSNSQTGKVRFTSMVIYRCVVRALYHERSLVITRLRGDSFRTVLDLLKFAIPLLTPRQLNHEVIKTKGSGASEAAFQTELQHALKRLLPEEYVSIIEAKTSPKDSSKRIDMLLYRGEERWAGLELKVGKTSDADLAKAVQQCHGYHEQLGVPIMLLNFVLRGHSLPGFSCQTPNLQVVHILFSDDYKNYVLRWKDDEGNEVSKDFFVMEP